MGRGKLMRLELLLERCTGAERSDVAPAGQVVLDGLPAKMRCRAEGYDGLRLSEAAAGVLVADKEAETSRGGAKVTA